MRKLVAMLVLMTWAWGARGQWTNPPLVGTAAGYTNPPPFATSTVYLIKSQVFGGDIGGTYSNLTVNFVGGIPAAQIATQTAAAVQAELNVHKTNAAAHTELFAGKASQADLLDASNRVVSLEGGTSTWNTVTGKLDASATNGWETGSHAGLYPSSNPSNYVTAAITNGLGGSGITANDVTNSLDLSVAPSLTGTVAKAAGALQGGETNALLDLAGTRAMTGNSVTLARDVKARDAGTVGEYGANFGYVNTVGTLGFGAGWLNTVDDWGFSAGEVNTVGTDGFGAGGANTVGALGFGAGHRGKGARGSFVFSDAADADFDRLAYTNWFSVRASGGAYFATPDLTVTGTVTAAGFAGGAAGTTNAITPGGLVDISGLLGGGGISAETATGIAQAVVAPWTNQVTGASIAAAGGLTNRTYVTPTALDCSPTTTITRAMIDAAPWGEMSLSLTQACYLTFDATVTNTADAATFALYITGTNALTWNTNQLTGTAWTNAPPCDRIFRKPARAGAVAIW